MNMRWASYMVVLLVLGGIAPADTEVPNDEGYFPGYYVGTVAGSPVQMELYLGRPGQVKQLHGCYYYEKYGSPLSLLGAIRESTIVLVERDADNKETGTFKIKPAFGEALGGIWNAKGKKSQPVVLKRVASTTHISEANRFAECDAWFPIFTGKSKPIIELNATLRAEAVAALAAFGKMNAENNEDDGIDAAPCVLSQRYQVRFWSPTVISVLVDSYVYTGGAHGNTALKSLNYQLIDGQLRQFAWRDIVKDKDQAEKALVKWVTADLLRRQVGWFRSGSKIPPTKLSLEDLDVYTFDPAGLTIHFPPYAVDCYAAGCVSVRIPWEQLRPHILPDGPLGKLARK